jgi:Cytochrome P450
MDFMSAYQFGLANSTNFTQDIDARRTFFHTYHSRRPYEFYQAEMPWLKPLCRKLGMSLVPKSLDAANEVLGRWQMSLCQDAEKYVAQQAESTELSPGDDPVVYKFFKNGLSSLRHKDPGGARAACDPSDPQRFADIESIVNAEIYSEMLDQLGAGHETSAIALTYLQWEMCRNPKFQQELRDEIASLTPKLIWPLKPEDTFDLPSPKDIDALAFLNGVLMETLRLHAPIPGMQPRVSPHTKSPTGNQLGRYQHIPGGVRVSSMPYCLHRNPDVFPRPESFEPHRWLPTHSSAEQLKEMNRWFWAFGSGGRMCIGSHLAIQELKLLVCAIYGNWKTEIADDTGIEEIDAYTTRPTSNRLMLRFEHI